METVGENRRRSSEYSIVDGFECVLVRAKSASCDHMLPSLHSSPANGPHHNPYLLLRLVQIAEKLDKSHILVTANCAIYSKAQQILWNKPAHLDGKVTMRLGGMHFNMAYMASIGKLYGDGGLLSILVNSDVYAPVTAILMLEGKQVSRGNRLRGMKLMLDTLYRLYQEAFWAWMQQRDQTDLRRNDMDTLVTDIQQAFASGDRRESDRLLFKQLESEHIATLQALQQSSQLLEG